MSARSRGVRPDVVTYLSQGLSGISGSSLHNLKCMCTLAVLRDTLLPKLIFGELWVKDAKRCCERV